MKRWNISVIVLAAAAFIFMASGTQMAFAADTPAKTEKIGKASSSAETKAMNKTDKTLKVKTKPNGADKIKKSGATTKADEAALKKGGKTQGGEK